MQHQSKRQDWMGKQSNASALSGTPKGVLTSLAADGTATFVFVFVSSVFSQVRQWQGHQALACRHRLPWQGKLIGL